MHQVSGTTVGAGGIPGGPSKLPIPSDVRDCGIESASSDVVTGLVSSGAACTREGPRVGRS